MKPSVGTALTASASSNLVDADAVGKLPKSDVHAESNNPRVLSEKHDPLLCKPSAVEDLFIPTHGRFYGDRPEKFRPSAHRNALKTAPSSAMIPSSFRSESMFKTLRTASQPHAHSVKVAGPLATRNDNMHQPLSAPAAAHSHSRQRWQPAFASETFHGSSQQEAAPTFAKLAETAVHSPVSIHARGSGALAVKTDSSPISHHSIGQYHAVSWQNHTVSGRIMAASHSIGQYHAVSWRYHTVSGSITQYHAVSWWYRTVPGSIMAESCSIMAVSHSIRQNHTV
jgi:hypothetical protein